MDQSAIKHIQDTAAAVTLSHEGLGKVVDDGHPLALLPSDFKVHSLEKYLDHRTRFRADFNTGHIGSFAKYHDQNGGDADVFIDKKGMAARAIFDIGDIESPGHGEHTATLSLEKTAAYKSLERIDNQGRIDQRKLAEWIEDWRDFITAHNNEEKTIPISTLVATVRNVDIETARNINSSEGDWNSSRSAMESIEVKSKVGSMPKSLTFTCPAYHGLPEQQFHFRISLNTGENNLSFTVVRNQAEADEELTAENFADVVRDALTANTEILQGTIAL